LRDRLWLKFDDGTSLWQDIDSVRRQVIPLKFVDVEVPQDYYNVRRGERIPDQPNVHYF
jgi:hypothetical protein